MIGTKLFEEFVQSVALTHRIRGFSRVGALFLAAPESGKTTITRAANALHVRSVAIISGRSVLRELADHPDTEFLLFNDLTAIRAMSVPAVNLLIVLLNQLTQDERGIVAFAGKESMEITRPVGVIGCMPFKLFCDNRAKWREYGFISRMIPFAYQYSEELVAEIKDSIDRGTHQHDRQPGHKMPKKLRRKPIAVSMTQAFVTELRHVADAKSRQLDQVGIRLLQNYHSLVRAHAVLHGRRHVLREDLVFIRAVNRFVSITSCATLGSVASQRARARI